MPEPTPHWNCDCHPDCHEDRRNPPLAAVHFEEAEVAFLAVDGLGCVSCANRVRNALLALPGVFLAEVDLDHHTVSVWHDPRRVTSHVLADAVASAGDDTHHYSASVIVATAEAVA